MNLETKITIYKFTPQVFTLTLYYDEQIQTFCFNNLFAINLITKNTSSD